MASPKKPKSTNFTSTSVEQLAESLEEGISQESPLPDVTTEAEANHYAHLKDKIDNEKLQRLIHENGILLDNREQRKLYAKHIFRLTCSWIAAIFVILFLKAWKIGYFELSDNVLITLITSTTINFFAFFLLILRYLFYTGKSDRSKATSRSNNKNKIKTPTQ